MRDRLLLARDLLTPSGSVFVQIMSAGRLFRPDNMTSQRPPGDFPVDLDGKTFRPGKGYWKTGEAGMDALKRAHRLMAIGNTLCYVRFLNDFPVFPVTSMWDDTVSSGFGDPKLYVVQTNSRIAERCIQMTTDPGDLVLDPTCGSGTWVEATIPTPVDWDGDGQEDSSPEAAQEYGSFVERMIEVLRRSPVLHLGAGRSVTLQNVRPPAKSLSLSAEALQVQGAGVQGAKVQGAKVQSAEGVPVSFVFGPENGAVSEKLVNAALTEARMKGYAHLYVVGFAIQPHARTLIDSADAMGLIPATYVQATPDLMMGDLLKNMRSSQIFSVCGLPEIRVHRAKPAAKDGPPRWQVELIGLDTFDPTTMKTHERKGSDVPPWFLDQDNNDLSFHVSQAFFPRTGAWNDLRKALKGDYDDSVWDHLAGTMSAPFEAGEHGQVAVKVIDDRGNELIVVKRLE
jgi:hypothetical protein